MVSKWMHTIDQWHPEMKYISKLGYNMIHFVPLQQRGASNSPYSIKNQLSLSDDLFKTKLNDLDKYEQFYKTIQRMERDCGLLSMSDIVWNHTSFDSEWLMEHPEVGYNLDNSKHLRMAYELDEAILIFSRDCQQEVKHIGELQQLIERFKEVVVGLKFWEYYVLDVEGLINEFDKQYEQYQKEERKEYAVEDTFQKQAIQLWQLAQLPTVIGKRFGKKINLSVCFQYLTHVLPNAEKNEVLLLLKKYLDEINAPFYKEYDLDLSQMLSNIKHRAEYERLAQHGPKLGPINQKNPLVSTYFTRLPQTDKNKHLNSDCLIVANNGWIWNADPLIDFAQYPSKSYFVREIIPWGDCVKLRYGLKPDDCPFLWRHMTHYTQTLARLFHGFRIDNCHSTPIHVAQYFLDVAREVNPNLYIVAELFTGSEERDLLFVRRLGIHSLIREAMNAWDEGELGRLCWKYGGQAVGSMRMRGEDLPLEMLGHIVGEQMTPLTDGFPNMTDYSNGGLSNGLSEGLSKKVSFSDEMLVREVPLDQSLNNKPWMLVQDPDESGRKTPQLLRRKDCATTNNTNTTHTTTTEHTTTHNKTNTPNTVIQEQVFYLYGSTPHALFMDCTHDNPTPFEKRTALDALSNSAVVCMSVCAVGSCWGYDYLVPKYLNVVTEGRRYKLLSSSSDTTTSTSKEGVCTSSSGSKEGVITTTNKGIVEMKKWLLWLRRDLGQKGYTEIHVHRDRDYLMIHRQHPLTHEGYLLIVRCAFSKGDTYGTGGIDGGTAGGGEGSFVGVLKDQEVRGVVWASLRVFEESYRESLVEITGLPSQLEMGFGQNTDMLHIQKEGGEVRLRSMRFPKGAVCLFETQLQQKEVLYEFRIQMNLSIHGSWYLDSIVRQPNRELLDVIEELGVGELNVLLYRCEDEEYDSIGQGCYVLPGVGKLKYAGLQGVVEVVREVAKGNLMGSLVCAHLREGEWLMDYCVGRVEKYMQKYYPGLKKYWEWFGHVLGLVKRLPGWLRPKYTILVVMSIWQTLHNHSLRMMNGWCQNGSRFIRRLAVGGIQFLGNVPSTSLSQVNVLTRERLSGKVGVSVAAGLPHFSVRHLRCWGRDIFISLIGLGICTGLYSIVREQILGFGSLLMNGLMPNLLDGGIRPRYNSRDAVWWWLRCLKVYCEESGDYNILEEKVWRRFPLSSGVGYCTVEEGYQEQITMKEILGEVMQRHFEGIHFREHNAGLELDSLMREEGFQIDIWTDLDTGFVYGGNGYNCGTWMDKMGECGVGRGVPATSRDGAAVELIALLKSSLDWMWSLFEEGRLDKGGVERQGVKWSYKEWSNKIQESFVECFYVPECSDEDHLYRVNSRIIHKRGIFKDCFNSSKEYTDYQLRPNVPIAMVICPDLFPTDKALLHLEKTEIYLKGRVGMRTLDPEDLGYRGKYENGYRGGDTEREGGWNYHQGPEWVWPYPFFLRAKHYYLGGGSAGIGNTTGGNDCTTPTGESTSESKKYSLEDMLGDLKEHRVRMEKDGGLVELMNGDGSECLDGCWSQAWSVGCVLEGIYFVSRSERVGESRE